MAPKKNPESAKRRAHEKEIERELHGIFGDDTRRSDMTRLDVARHSGMKKAAVGLIVFLASLAVISWAGFFFFSPEKKFSGEGVRVTIEGPADVKSGDLVTFAVRYKNDEKVPLGTADLEVRLPKQFQVQKTDPAAGNGHWSIGSIDPGKDGMVTIQGVFLAPLGKQLDLQAILTYRPADFNSEFQKVSTQTVTISDSVLELTVDGPPKVLPGDKVTLTFSYHNASASPFQDLRFRPVFPDKFIPDSATPKSEDDQYQEWKIDSLPPDGKGTIAITGTFASDAQGAIDLKGDLGFIDENQQFQLQKEATFSADVSQGDLVVEMVLNGKSGNQPINFGDTLRYAVTYKNTGTSTLKNVQLSAVFDPSPDQLLQWNSLKDRAHGVRTQNRLTWTKRQVPSLAEIGPGEEGTLDFQLPIVAQPTPDVADYEVTSWVEATIGRIDDADVNRTTKTPAITAKVLSDTALAAEARYFVNGTPVGTGPLPPKVGQKTVYRIFWKITNSLHELTDLKLSAELPDGVTWTGMSTVDAGDLKFDASSRKMAWTLNWLPTTIKTLNVSFDLAITPTPDEQGKIPTLLEGSILQATDKFTGDPMLLSAPPLTTDLTTDSDAAGKSRVQ